MIFQTKMQYRDLGKTGIKISALGLGTFGWSGAYGPVSDIAMYSILKNSIESGITVIDTADIYAQGKVEKKLGKWLKEFSRDELIISTKGGLGELPPSSFMAIKNPAMKFQIEIFTTALEKSLKRLQTSYIDIYHMNYPQIPDFQNIVIENLIASWKDKGLIRASAASVQTLDEARQAINSGFIDIIDIEANIFQLTSLKLLLPLLEQTEIGLLIRSPLAHGFLTGTYQNYPAGISQTDIRNASNSSLTYQLFYGMVQKSAQIQQALQIRYPEESLASLSLRLLLDYETVSSLIVGMHSPFHLMDNLKALALAPLREQDLIDIKHVMRSTSGSLS